MKLGEQDVCINKNQLASVSTEQVATLYIHGCIGKGKSYDSE